jgi:hypothetical protein
MNTKNLAYNFLLLACSGVKYISKITIEILINKLIINVIKLSQFES